MPFDGKGFPSERPEPGRRRKPGERTVATLIVVIATWLLLMPISLAAFVDIVQYVRGR